jgi:hypothetical protein
LTQINNRGILTTLFPFILDVEIGIILLDSLDDTPYNDDLMEKANAIRNLRSI